MRKYSIDSNLTPTGSEFQSGEIANAIKHDEEVHEEYAEGSVKLTGRNFDRVSHLWVDLIWIVSNCYEIFYVTPSADSHTFLFVDIQFWLWTSMLLGAIGATDW